MPKTVIDWSKYRTEVNNREKEDREHYRAEIEKGADKIVLNYVGDWSEIGVTTSKGVLLDHDELWDLLTRYKYLSILSNVSDPDGKCLLHRGSKKLGRVLELGCDWGHAFSCFESYFDDVYGIEATQLSADRGRREGKNVTHGVMEFTPYRDGFFDLVSSRHVLEHGNDPDVVLKEINRITKSGGWSVHALPVCMGMKPPKDSIIHKSNLTQDQWIKKFKRHGFQIVNTFYSWNHDQEEFNILARKDDKHAIFSSLWWRFR